MSSCERQVPLSVLSCTFPILLTLMCIRAGVTCAGLIRFVTSWASRRRSRWRSASHQASCTNRFTAGAHLQIQPGDGSLMLIRRLIHAPILFKLRNTTRRFRSSLDKRLKSKLQKQNKSGFNVTQFKYPGITEIWRHFMLICWNWLWGGRTPSQQETGNTGNKGRRSCSKKKESQEQNIWKFSSAVFKKLSFTLKWFGTFKIKDFLKVFIGSLI